MVFQEANHGFRQKLPQDAPLHDVRGLLLEGTNTTSVRLMYYVMQYKGLYTNQGFKKRKRKFDVGISILNQQRPDSMIFFREHSRFVHTHTHTHNN